MAQRQPRQENEGQREAVSIALRSVAKLGLDDPSQLTGLGALLDLAEVRRCAKSPDALGRARAFVALFLDLLTDVARDSSERRRELLSCLFRYDGATWDDKITRRREHLAEGTDTSAFRRDEEEPLYAALAALLLERYDKQRPSLVDPAKGQRELADLYLAFANSKQLIEKHLSGELPRYLDGTLLSLASFCELHTKYDDLYNGDGYELLRAIFPTPEAFKEFQEDFLPIRRVRRYRDDPPYPFDSHELSVLRQQRRLAGTEAGLFLGYFREVPEGQQLYEAWIAWLNACECGSPPAPSCGLHVFLSACSQFCDPFVSAVDEGRLPTPPPLREHEKVRKLAKEFMWAGAQPA
jgi:hypothetical protein